jgi:hypothetical protein
VPPIVIVAGDAMRHHGAKLAQRFGIERETQEPTKRRLCGRYSWYSANYYAIKAIILPADRCIP